MDISSTRCPLYHYWYSWFLPKTSISARIRLQPDWWPIRRLGMLRIGAQTGMGLVLKGGQIRWFFFGGPGSHLYHPLAISYISIIGKLREGRVEGSSMIIFIRPPSPEAMEISCQGVAIQNNVRWGWNRVHLQLRHSISEANGYANDGYFALMGAQIYAGFEALRKSKMAMDNSPFTDQWPIKTFIYRAFPS